jgi:hypothetical protein
LISLAAGLGNGRKRFTSELAGLGIRTKRLRHGLRGAELIRLVAGRYVEFVMEGTRFWPKPLVVPLDNPSPPADPNLLELLETIRSRGRPRQVAFWVSEQLTSGVTDGYLHQLEARGITRSESSRLRGTRWCLVETARAATVRQRMDEITASPNPPGIEERSLAGLAHAMDMEGQLYPGSEGKERRERLVQITKADHPVSLANDQALSAAVTAVIKAAWREGRH